MKMWITSLTSAIVGSALSLTMVGQAQSAKTPSAVAFVNANRIFTESIHGRGEGTRMQTTQQQKANELRTKQQALEATRQQLATADAATRGELQQKELQQRTDLERSTQQAQVDLQNLQREVNTELQRRVKLALDEILKNQPYQVVLNADSSVVWGAPELDLTNAVVSRMNGQ